MIAALFVDPRGCYAGLPDVDLWDEARDARRYAGPHSVVAHPPCSRWCRLAGLVEARWGHKRGEDGGCFASALASVRVWGGVLEHPAYSDAFAAHGLPAPIRGAQWQRTICGGWVVHVEQRHYGHPAKKATWLYAHGTRPPLVDARAQSDSDSDSDAIVSWCGNNVSPAMMGRRRLTSREASATPPAFRDLLISIAKGVPK